MIVGGEPAVNVFCVLWLNPFPRPESSLLYGAWWEAELAAHGRRWKPQTLMAVG